LKTSKTASVRDAAFGCQSPEEVSQMENGEMNTGEDGNVASIKGV
jgi:hypothetical protein